MSNEDTASIPQEPKIDGLTRAQWLGVLKTLTADPGWLAAASLLAKEVSEANETVFDSADPGRQLALHEAIGFIRFANRLDEIRNRARAITESVVSPDDAFRAPPV